MSSITFTTKRWRRTDRSPGGENFTSVFMHANIVGDTTNVQDLVLVGQTDFHGLEFLRGRMIWDVSGYTGTTDAKLSFSTRYKFDLPGAAGAKLVLTASVGVSTVGDQGNITIPQNHSTTFDNLNAGIHSESGGYDFPSVLIGDRDAKTQLVLVTQGVDGSGEFTSIDVDFLITLMFRNLGPGL